MNHGRNSLLLLSHEKRRIERENHKLRELLAGRDRLYSVIGHDLRSSVGTLKMIAAALEREKDGVTCPEISRLVDMLNTSADDVFNLLESLLQWFGRQGDSVGIRSRHFSLRQCINEVVGLFSTVVRMKGIRLLFAGEDDFIVCGDEDLLRTVLRNLLSNAVKFSLPGGGVEVSFSADGGDVIVCVRDEGRGISTSDQARLLKAGDGLVRSGTFDERGFGLGLVLCFDFVRMNRGRLFFNSEEGAGSLFCFTIPLSISQPDCLSDSC